jgi:hypothetical protein
VSISVKTQKMLWGRAANRCAVCRKELVMDATETDDESLVGEACHIVAESPDGPRGKSEFTAEQRDKYANLVLLCNVHHKQVDDQFVAFTVARLAQLKSDHERWVRTSLGTFDAAKQRDDETYAGYIDEWARRAFLDNWQDWSIHLLSHGQPSFDKEVCESLDELCRWILGRVWPGRYPALESAFLNLRLVLQDLLKVFYKHGSIDCGASLLTEKFYQIPESDAERYEALAAEYEHHVGLVEDLMLELTRAANLLCDRVREVLIPSFRIREGVLLVQAGPYMDLSWKTYRAEYRGEERVDRPYPGLQDFESVRFKRDFWFGRPKKKPNKAMQPTIPASGGAGG